MDNLLGVMQIIDRNSTNFAEGDYLEVCNLLKKAYDRRSDPVYFFNYDEFRILPVGADTSSLTFEYFYDHYFEKALQFDSDFIQGQLNYLQKEYESAGPIRRITQNVRDKVEMHCYSIYGIPPGENTLEELGMDPVDFRKMCKTYVALENDFRATYRETIEKRILWLEDSEERLDTL